MICPCATATMSTVPTHAQAKATTNTAMMVKATARPIGDGGVSTISSAAGRNASSSLRRSGPCLEAIEGGISATGLDQIVMGAILDQAAPLDGDDPVGQSQRRQPMGDDKHRS